MRHSYLLCFLAFPHKRPIRRLKSVRKIYMVNVQPAHNQASIDGLKERIVCRKKNGTTQGFNAYESLTGVLGQYVFTGKYGSCLHRWEPSEDILIRWQTQELVA